jgi:hypothetical protein
MLRTCGRLSTTDAFTTGDFFLLGVTTFIAGLLGVPAPNGLIPQAPMHTASLVVLGVDRKHDEEELADISGLSSVEQQEKVPFERQERPVAVVEQRVSNLVQGSLCTSWALEVAHASRG